MTLAALVLLIGGIVLILAEFLLPGGVLGIVGGLMVLASTALGIYQFPEATLFIIFGEVLAIFGAVLFGFYYIAKGPWGKLLVNESAQRAEDGYVNAPNPTHLLGQTGVVMTALRPAGTIIVGEDRYDAVADGAFIDRDASVRVIEVHGNRIVVELAEESEATGEVPA